MAAYLLTIAIPTYNRSESLDRCLGKIVSQLIGMEDTVELIVSDNASTDNTKKVVGKYEIQYPLISCENSKNEGADFNIANCYNKAKGKYVWIFGDDDFILPDTLKPLVDLLAKSEVGIMHLEKLWYNDLSEVLPSDGTLNPVVYTSPLDFIDKINWWVTFITGNIVNKEMTEKGLEADKFACTNLIQLAWVIPAIFSSRQNILIQKAVIACQSNNTGGYKFFKVFAENFNKILSHFVSLGYDPMLKRIINTHLLSSFFPMFLDANDDKSFKRDAYVKEDPLPIMLSIYWTYPIFWRSTLPILLKNRFPILIRLKRRIFPH